jgi:hypothetical protein
MLTKATTAMNTMTDLPLVIVDNKSDGDECARFYSALSAQASIGSSKQAISSPLRT